MSRNPVWFNDRVAVEGEQLRLRGERDRFLTDLQTHEEALRCWAGTPAVLATLDIHVYFIHK